MDTGTIAILAGLVVVIILIGFINSFIRGKRGRVEPPQAVLEVRDDDENTAMPDQQASEEDDELTARAEEQAVEEDAAEQDDALRNIRDTTDGNGVDRER